MSNTPTTDRFGHRVPTRAEIDGQHPDEAENPIQEQMDERMMRYHNQR